MRIRKAFLQCNIVHMKSLNSPLCSPCLSFDGLCSRVAGFEREMTLSQCEVLVFDGIFTQLKYMYSFMVVSLNGYETKSIDAGVAPSRQISIYENSYLAPKLVGIKQKKCIIYC